MISTEDLPRVHEEADKAAAAFMALQGAGARCKNGARWRVRATYGHESGPFVLALARELWSRPDCRWYSYCLARYHRAAFALLDEPQVEAFGQGVANAKQADDYAYLLAGPAWLAGVIDDGLIERWARADNRWWRRAALVSTVALNSKVEGGLGDAPRTLAVCQILRDDPEPVVREALDLALRRLAKREPEAVEAFTRCAP